MELTLNFETCRFLVTPENSKIDLEVCVTCPGVVLIVQSVVEPELPFLKNCSALPSFILSAAPGFNVKFVLFIHNADGVCPPVSPTITLFSIALIFLFKFWNLIPLVPVPKLSVVIVVFRKI